MLMMITKKIAIINILVGYEEWVPCIEVYLGMLRSSMLGFPGSIDIYIIETRKIRII